MIPFWFLLLLTGSVAEKCFDAANFHTEKGFIRVNGLPLVLKGISWFGAETETLVPHGLWSYSMDSFLDILVRHNFNAIRIPFSLQMVRENKPNTNVNAASNPDLKGKTGLEVMEILVDKAAARGLLIMLDYHHIRQRDGINELWHDGEYPESEVLNLWGRVLDRLGKKWNVFAIDLKNEPHGRASWGWEKDTDWNRAAERFIRALSPKFNNLFFVEGVEANAASPYKTQVAHWWGENLEGVEWHPIRTGNSQLDKKVVYSPHVYGPDVNNQQYFNKGFPNNMPAIWNQHFKTARDKSGQPVVIGEWGGHFRKGSQDEVWHNKLVDYLIENGLTDQFYWCFNPNSGDTGGFLLDDWRKHDEHKAQMLWRLVPHPTKFQAKNGKICIEPGKYPNEKYNF